MKKAIAFSTLILMLSTTLLYPIATHAQITEARQDITTQSVIDAKTDVKAAYAWGAGGLIGATIHPCLGLPVVIGSLLFTPSPPAHRLLGKSPEYVLLYTDTYVRETKNQRGIYASVGCLGGTVLYFVLWSAIYSLSYSY